MILSSASHVLLEDVAAEAAPGAILWMQMFFYQNRSMTEDLVKRAERSGYQAIVVTVKLDLTLNCLLYLRNYFHHLHSLQVDAPGIAEGKLKYHNGRNNYSDPIPWINYDRYKHLGDGAQYASDLSWSDVDWIVNLTNLPVILKGVVTAEDAILAVNHGAKGILVSNHGGRQLDSVPATVSTTLMVNLWNGDVTSTQHRIFVRLFFS